jgi:hypothetical protein
LEEDFDKALLRFQNFLKSNGFPPHVVWLTPADVLLTGSKLLYVRVPDPIIAQMAVCSAFKQGLERGNGILLKGMFCEQDTTFSCVWVPKDREEAADAWLPPIVKLAVVTSETLNVIVVRSDEQWEALASRYRNEQALIMQLFS